MVALLGPAVPPGIARDGWRATMAVLRPGLLHRRAPTADDGPAARAIGARWPAPLAGLLRSIMVHQHVIGEASRGDADRLELLDLTQQWTTWLAGEVEAGYRAARSAPDAETLVRRLLVGPDPAAADDGDLAALGLDPDRPYHAVRARLTDAAGADAVARYLGLADAPGTGLLTVVDDDAWGFCATLPDGPPPTTIGVSAATPVPGLPDAFRRAGRALDAGLAAGRRERLTLDDVGVDAAVAADRELGRLLAERYLAPVLVLGSAGEPILSTVERYVANATRLEVTAHDLDVHPNTVRYRLNRYEELTGATLRDVKVLCEIWWAQAWLRQSGGPVRDA